MSPILDSPMSAKLQVIMSGGRIVLTEPPGVVRRISVKHLHESYNIVFRHMSILASPEFPILERFVNYSVHSVERYRIADCCQGHFKVPWQQRIRIKGAKIIGSRLMHAHIKSGCLIEQRTVFVKGICGKESYMISLAHPMSGDVIRCSDDQEI